MRRLLIIITAISLAACGEGLIDTTEVLEGDIASQTDPMIQKTLKVVDMGIIDGDKFMTLKVNEVLQGFNIKFFYHGMSTLTHEADVMVPTGGQPGCPYVGATVTSGFDSGPQSCRFLADKSLEAADLAKDQIDPNQAVDEDFSQKDGNLPHYRAWYMNGANSSIEMTAVLIAGTLRQAAVCDNAPSPKESAFQRGKALGKKLYIQAMNERLKQVGIDFTYPNGTKPTKSIRYCKANLRDPALAAAKARVASSMAQEPLCSGIGNDPIEQSGFFQEYKEVEKEYQAGIYSGMMGEDVKSQHVLQAGKCCIASPLVLDLAGDGLNMGGKVDFDLLGNGGRVETSWIRGDDALLVLDANENGRIDDGNELFGNTDEHASGFENLATHDANNDGVIDARDPIYSQLRLWQDNGDGVSAAGELSTLPQMGVKAIELSYTESARVDLHGNQLRQTARFIRTAEFAGALGADGTVVDVWFNYK
jgi:hypothetical protein